MKLWELRDILQEIEESFGEEEAGEMDIRFASQPNWPFEYSVGRDYAVFDNGIYLAERDQTRYLPGDVSRELGWS